MPSTRTRERRMSLQPGVQPVQSIPPEPEIHLQPGVQPAPSCEPEMSLQPGIQPVPSTRQRRMSLQPEVAPSSTVRQRRMSLQPEVAASTITVQHQHRRDTVQHRDRPRRHSDVTSVYMYVPRAELLDTSSERTYSSRLGSAKGQSTTMGNLSEAEVQTDSDSRSLSLSLSPAPESSSAEEAALRAAIAENKGMTSSNFETRQYLIHIM